MHGRSINVILTHSRLRKSHQLYLAPDHRPAGRFQGVGNHFTAEHGSSANKPPSTPRVRHYTKLTADLSIKLGYLLNITLLIQRTTDMRMMISINSVYQRSVLVLRSGRRPWTASIIYASYFGGFYVTGIKFYKHLTNSFEIPHSSSAVFFAHF